MFSLMAFESMKRFLKVQLSVTAMFITASNLLATNSYGATLSWSANREVDLAGYKLYYGSSSQNYHFVIDLGNVTNYDLKNLNLIEGVTYYVALSVYDTAENESDLSQELVYFAEDEIPEDVDNCPEIYNPEQEDTFPPGGNGIGDACECEGDFNCDRDVDGADIIFFKTDFGRSLFNNPCNAIDPCSGDFDCDGDVDGLDGMLFKADFGRASFNNPCPLCTVGEWCVYP
jgi:hypothetical protein